MKNSSIYSNESYSIKQLLKTVVFWQSVFSLVSILCLYLQPMEIVIFKFLYLVAIACGLIPLISVIWSFSFVIYSIVKKSFHIKKCIPLGISLISRCFIPKTLIQFAMAVCLAEAIGI